MKKNIYIVSFVILMIILGPSNILGKEILGLVIIAHGSPMLAWNTPVLELEGEVSKLWGERGNNPFSAVRVALMEFSEPSINTVIEEFERSGIDRVYALPLFIAPSGHSLFDVPTILRIYYEAGIVEEIKAEGTTIVDTKMKITLGPTLDSGDALKEIMLDRVKELSNSPETEGVVLLAHGDHYFKPVWDGLCGEIGSFICAKTGIENYDYAYVEIGQSFIAEGVPTISRMGAKCERTIVVGLYLSMGVDKMAHNSVLSMGRMQVESREALKDYNIIYAERGLLPDPRVSQWIIEKALEWVEGER